MREITSLEEIKNIELSLMKRIHKFCKENQINYCLSHGTLLGAVRHHGFIPWDDDIDLFMPREDYKKFCSIFPVWGEKNEMELVNYTTPIYFGRAMSKVIDTRTELKEADFQGDDMIGVFVDIWPLDGVPSSSAARRIHMCAVGLLRKLALGKTVAYVQKRTFLQKLNHFAGASFSSRWLLKKLEQRMCKFPFRESKYVTCYVDPYHVVMEREWFLDNASMRFEDADFFVPLKYDKILAKLYGDYMKLPPKEKQVPHHRANIYWKDGSEQ